MIFLYRIDQEMVLIPVTYFFLSFFTQCYYVFISMNKRDKSQSDRIDCIKHFCQQKNRKKEKKIEKFSDFCNMKLEWC